MESAETKETGTEERSTRRESERGERGRGGAGQIVIQHEKHDFREQGRCGGNFHGMNIYELSTRNLTGALNCNQNAQQMYSWQSALAVFMPAMKAWLAAISTEQPVAPVSLGASMAS